MSRICARIFRRRRCENLNSRVFRAKARIKEILTLRQKVLLIVSVLVVGGVIGFSQFSGYFDVTKVTILRNSLDLPIEDIELTVRELAMGKNILKVDSDFLATAVKELRPDTAKVQITKAYPNEIQVEVFKYPIKTVQKADFAIKICCLVFLTHKSFLFANSSS